MNYLGISLLSLPGKVSAKRLGKRYLEMTKPKIEDLRVFILVETLLTKVKPSANF